MTAPRILLLECSPEAVLTQARRQLSSSPFFFLSVTAPGELA